MRRNMQAAVFALGILGGIMPTPPASAQLAVFDGANFVKNSATEINTLQQLQQQIQQVEYQYQQLLAATQSLKGFSWQDAMAQLQQLDTLLNKDNAVCQNLQYSNQYFSDSFPGFNANVNPACDSANLTQVHNQINDLRQVISQQPALTAQNNSALDAARTASDSAPGTKAAIQAEGQAIGAVGQILQQQTQMQKAAALAQAAYYDAQIAKQKKNEQEESTTRRYFNYFWTGTNSDPMATPTPAPQST